MPELDHLVFASTDLEAGVTRIEEATGARAVPGGPHPGWGTRNALLTFDETTYFEIIGIDPDQPAPTNPRPFGLDRGTDLCLAGYAIHPASDETIDDVVRLLGAFGHDPGPVVAMSRIRPDGEELAWRLSTIGDREAPNALPFAIDWGSTPSPARSLPSMGRLVEFRVLHPDPATRATIEGLDLGIVVADGPPRLGAVVESHAGRVQIV